MGARVSRTDFEWVHTEEPHASRRKIILEKYPQIKQLFGYDPNLKWVVTGMVLLQLVSLPVVAQLSWPLMLLAAYCFGGVINHSLMTAIHEISHNLAFGNTRPVANKWFGFLANLPIGFPASITFRKYHVDHHRISHNLAFGNTRPVANKWFGFLANLPIGFPASITFRKYHVDHHRYQGLDTVDPDLPTLLEAKLFNSALGKLAWLVLQPFFYAVRPALVRPKPPQLMEMTNLVVQLFFDAVVVEMFGWKALWYLVFGTLMASGVHPMAGHFVADHYMFRKGFETYSYYGALNVLTFNAGYHVEHHDFPAVPGSRLPEVKRIAAEFYDDLPHHTSWTSVLFDFVMDPEIGPYARIKREKNSAKHK